MSIEELSEKRIPLSSFSPGMSPKVKEQLATIERLSYCVGARDAEIAAMRAFCVAIRCKDCLKEGCTCYKLKHFSEELEVCRNDLSLFEV